jgi:methyl-accepting chemotaxis protein
MKLRTRLTLAFLVCGLLPLCISALVNYYTSTSGMKSIETTGTTAMEAKAKDQLVALRDAKKAQVEQYFNFVSNHIQTYAESPSTIEAMKTLNQNYHSFRENNKIESEQLNTLRQDLAEYYGNDFLGEFKKQNGDKASLDVEKLINQLDDDAIALQHTYISNNRHQLGTKNRLARATDGSPYSEVHGKVHPVVNSFLEAFGYYDIFLVDIKSGDIVYSVYKELDFATSLIDGPFAQSQLGEAFRKASNASSPDSVYLVDFDQYLPSYNAPASFISAPIFDGPNKIGVVIFQMPIKKINDIMAMRSGMGKSGETYMVGEDHLMRCDSFNDPEHRSIIASFTKPEEGSVNTDPVNAALAGKSGVEATKDYLGAPVLSAYTPVNVLGLKWALLAEIDAAEAFAAVTEMQNTASQAGWSLVTWTLVVAVLSAIGVLAIALPTSSRIAKPISRVADYAKMIASKNLSEHCDVHAQAEVQDLVTGMNVMRNSLRDVVSSLNENATMLADSSNALSGTATELANGAEGTTQRSATVAAAAEEMSTNMRGMASATEEMSTNVKTVAAAIEEMTASIGEIARNAERASGVADQAAAMVEVSNEKVCELGNAADEIGKVIDVIQDIADQTNLLALNATIEAARAGEAGKGFAVVATEVKELAKQSAAATDSIRQRIQGIQGSSGQTIKAIAEISAAIKNVNEVSRSIAAAVEEQSIATKEISRNVAETSTAAETVSRGVTESASACQEITTSIAGVDQAAQQTSIGATQAKSVGTKMLSLAGELQTLVAQFRV